MTLPSIFAQSIDLAELVDVTDVEVCQTGIEYHLASGPRTFTTSDLKSAVDSQGDAAVKTPRLKLGHVANIGLMADGQPAIGTVTDMKLEQGGHLITGTYKGIPKWLANILPSAYPARSIEGAVGVKTATQNTWDLVITDLALLGVIWPGVTTLEDIQALYSVDGPDNVQVLTTKEEVAALSVAAAAVVNAQVDTDNVMRAWREHKTGDQMWWWVRSMMMDPNELIVEDEDEGELYRIPYAIKGEDVTFSDPIPVKIVYEDKPKPKEDKQAASLAAAAAIGAFQSLHPQSKQLAQFSTREEFNMSGVIASDVDPVALRESLGLEASATDDEVRTAIANAGFAAPPGQEPPAAGTGAPASEQPGTTATGGEGQPDNTAPSGATDPNEAHPNVAPATEGGSQAGTVEPPTNASGVVQLDRDTYERLRRGAAAGEQALATQVTAERDRVISAAIKEGRIAPSRAQYWQAQWKADQQGTRMLLTAAADKGGLAPGLIPVVERGGESPIEDTTVEAYPADWLPEVAARKAQAQGGGQR